MAQTHLFSWALYDDLLTYQQLQARDIWADAQQVGNRARYFLDRDGNVLARKPINPVADAICCATIAGRDPGQEVTMLDERVLRELEAADRAPGGGVTFPGMAAGAGASGAMPIRAWWRKLCAFVGGAGMAVALLASGHAEAQMPGRMPCHNATEIAKQLSQQYDEAPVAFGLQSNGNLLQVYSSVANGTWTIVSTTPAGMSCIVAVGKRWESLPVPSTDPMA